MSHSSERCGLFVAGDAAQEALSSDGKEGYALRAGVRRLLKVQPCLALATEAYMRCACRSEARLPSLRSHLGFLDCLRNVTKQYGIHLLGCVRVEEAFALPVQSSPLTLPENDALKVSLLTSRDLSVCNDVPSL